MQKYGFAIAAVLAAALVLPARSQSQGQSQAASQAAQQPGATLSISGYAGQIPIVQINGKSYVEVEQLARVTQGSVTFRLHQTILTLPATAPAAAPAPHAAVETPKQGFSKGFLQAAIEHMGVLREWRVGIVNAVQSDTPAPADWISAQRRLADKSLALASTAILTADDRKAFPFLSAELNNLQKLSDRYLDMRKNVAYISPDFLNSEPLDQQIRTCAQGISNMTTSNQFQDEPACH